MKHNLSIEGQHTRLRPVREEDAEAIIDLRMNKEHSRFLHSISGKMVDQLDWMRQYFQREGDYYFIVENKKLNSFEGTIAIYDVSDNVAEWGRWVLKPNSLFAAESAFLIYQIGFEILGLDRLYCRTVAMNESVVSFHDRCNLKREKVIKNAFLLHDKNFDAIEHVLRKENWPDTKSVLLKHVQNVTKLLARMDKNEVQK